MTYNLFLDDIRDPTWVYNHPPFKEWVVCRNYQEAVDIVNSRGFPAHVSFDHDLGDDSKSGFDFAKWLVNKDLDDHSMPNDWTYNIHSANGIGRENIKGLLDAYIKYRTSNSE